MRAKRRAPAVAAAAAAAALGCGVTADLPADPMGAVDVSFVVSGRLSLSRMGYTVEGNGFGPVQGTIDLTSGAANVSATVGGMPSGRGYSLTLTGITDDQGAFCGGTATFDVVAPAPTKLQLRMICVSASSVRTVTQDGVAHTCPAVASVAAASAVDGLTLSGSAYVFDADPVSYRWEATSGTLSRPDEATTSYACGASGPQTLRLQVHDPYCVDLALLDVTCP